MPTYESHVTTSPVFDKPAKIIYPFAAQGDNTTKEVHQPYIQLADRYAPPTLGAVFVPATDANFSGSPVSIGTAYCIGDTEPQEGEAGIVSFTRKWSNLPTPQKTFTTGTSTIPYVSVFAGGANARFFRTVTIMNYGEFILVNRALPSGSITSISSITRSGATATVTTSSAHGLTTNDIVRISGTTQTEYSIDSTITVTASTTFTYPVSGTPATPATGSPVGVRIGAGTVYASPGYIPTINGNTVITINGTTGEITENTTSGPLLIDGYIYQLGQSEISNHKGDIYIRTAKLIQGA